MGRRCSVVAFPVLVSFACSGLSLERRAPSLDAIPDPDPAARFTVQEPLAPEPLDHVVFKASLGDPGGLRIVDVLTPDLDRSISFQLRQSFSECLWKPAVDESGEPQEGGLTLLSHHQLSTRAP